MYRGIDVISMYRKFNQDWNCITKSPKNRGKKSVRERRYRAISNDYEIRPKFNFEMRSHYQNLCMVLYWYIKFRNYRVR